jgi:flagellar biosynthetic protein FliQ
VIDQEQQAVDVVNQALEVTIELALPLLIAALAIGLIVSILQTATSIQEQTLSFVPKIIAVGVLIMLLFPWMSQVMSEYTTTLWADVMPTFLVSRPAGG